MSTLRDIGVSALINIGLTMLFLLSYVFVSLQPVNDRVYYPKLYIKGQRQQRASPRQLKAVEKYVNLEWWQYTRLLAWAKSALRKNEDDIIQHAGLDSAVFLRIFLVGLKIFVPLMILGFAILVPVNVGAGSLAETGTSNVNANTTDTKFLFSSIDRLSMSNVPNNSPRLWAHLVMSYVFTAWVCFILFMEYKSIAALRLRFLSDEKRRPDQFTVMVLQIPDKGIDPLSKQVGDYFSKVHPDHYLTHQMAYNVTKLSKIVKERDKAHNWLDYFELKQKRNPATRPMTKTGFCGFFGNEVDAIDNYKSQVEQLSKEAEAEREVIINDAKATMPAAFVSFKTRWGAAVCAKTQQNQDPTLWLTDWAPEPRDVYWANLAIPYVQLGFRKLAVGVIVFLLVFFYMIPVAAVQSLANLEGLRRSIPALDGFLQKSFVASFVQGFLPGLALKLFFHFLPDFLLLITKVEGHLAISKIERRAAAKYYYFVVVNIFFGSMLTGSAFQQLKTFVTSASFLGFINTLASSIPQNASFFITYIMVDGWSGPAGELLRLKPLVKYHLKNALFCRTERDRLEAASPGTLTLDQTLPQVLLYFLMGLVYSVITPVILPFIIIFLAFAFVVYRNQVINVYDPVYESAGAFWPHVHRRIVASLILEHLTLLGLFLVKGPISFVATPPGSSLKHKILRYVRDSCSSTPFMVALPVLTLCFHNYCKKRFEPAFTNYPLEDAMAKDTAEMQDEPDLNLAVFLRNAYKHPDFSDEKEGAELDEEKGGEGGETMEENDEPAADDEFVQLEESQEEESSPLRFKWGAFHAAGSRSPSLRRDSMGRYHSARSYFDSTSSRSNFSHDESPSSSPPPTDSELARVRSLQRYLQGQLSRESSLMESLRARDKVARMDDDDAAALQRFMRAQLSRQSSMADLRGAWQSSGSTSPGGGGGGVLVDIDNIAYFQRYLRGQLSRQNSSSSESGGSPSSSPLTFRTGRFGTTSPLQRLPRARTMSTIREDSDHRKARYSRAMTMGTLGREVIYLDSPSFVSSRPHLKRAKTLSTLLKEPRASSLERSGDGTSSSTSEPVFSEPQIHQNQASSSRSETQPSAKKKTKKSKKKSKKSSSSSSSSSSSPSSSSSSSSSDDSHDPSGEA